MSDGRGVGGYTRYKIVHRSCPNFQFCPVYVHFVQDFNKVGLILISIVVLAQTEFLSIGKHMVKCLFVLPPPLRDPLVLSATVAILMTSLPCGYMLVVIHLPPLPLPNERPQ